MTHHLRPPGIRIRVLLQSTNLASVENEVHLPQTSLGRPLDGVTLLSQLDHVGVLDETREQEPGIAKPDRS
jgi:hypothetical protein